MSISPWHTLGGWQSMSALMRRRLIHSAQEGHEKWCVLEDPAHATTADAVRCTRAVPLVQTAISKWMEPKLQDLLEEVKENPAEREPLMLHGPAYVGKTMGTMLAVMNRCSDVWNAEGTKIQNSRSRDDRIPWVYVEVGEKWGYKGVLAQAQKFTGLIAGENDTGEERLRQLEQKLVDFGTEGIVIDDSHRLRTMQNGTSVDGLKSILSLPLVFVHLGLTDFPTDTLLFGNEGAGTSSEQLEERANVYDTNLGYEPSELRKEWDDELDILTVQFHVDEAQMVAFLSNVLLRENLYRVTQGRFGRTYKMMRQACVNWIRDPTTGLSVYVKREITRFERMRPTTDLVADLVADVVKGVAPRSGSPSSVRRTKPTPRVGVRAR